MLFFFFNDTATTEIYTLSLHDALPISSQAAIPFDLNTTTSALDWRPWSRPATTSCNSWTSSQSRIPCWTGSMRSRSEEHTSELQSRQYLVCRLLLEKKKKQLTRVHTAR